jgi:16S rRNA processing protein RimM
MKPEKCIKAGSVLKTHGKNGEIILGTDTKLSGNLAPENFIFIEIDRALVPFFIENVISESSGSVILKIEDIDTAEEAKYLIKKDWYVQEDQKNKSGNHKADNISLKGFKLINQDNEEIGKVIDFINIPSNNLLQVRYEDKTIEVPFNENTLISIDEEKEIIKIHIPEGLLDLE